MKLVVEVEVQSYNGVEEEREALETLREALVAVVSVADLSVGTFAKSRIEP